MSNTILTPITLWRDFDESLPLNEEIISETESDGVVYKELYLLGRQTDYGRVKIYAKYYTPTDAETYPAVMVLFEAGFPADYTFVHHLIDCGYAVLCVDYCGDMGEGRHTIYPRDIDYANFIRAGRAMHYADNTAKETSWYEWAAVARYAVRYLKEKKEVTQTGAIGLRTGGEILWKIAPYASLSCMISVCAAGWLAFRDIEKFSDGKKIVFDEERHRFIAGIDSQSYAPHVKCPVLLLSAINDKKSNYDRVYDTFQQINPEVEKAFLYSAHGNGLIGSHSIANIDLFLDKYLKRRSVYLSKPVKSSVFADEENNLKVKIEYDTAGEPEDYGVFYTEKLSSYMARSWTCILGKAKDLRGDFVTLPLDIFIGSEKALIYTFVRYSNGFSVTSKIQEISLNHPYKNSCMKSRILYSAEQGIEGFSVFRKRAEAIADCFTDSLHNKAELGYGFGGIPGISCKIGLVSYRVSEPRFEPPYGAAFKFDAYSATDTTLNVIFYTDMEEEEEYSCTFHVSGSGKWKKFVCESNDFKSKTGNALSDFSSAVSVVFLSEDDVLLNHILWL